MYKQLSKEFNECHQSPANVLIHLATTPSFYISLFGILRLYNLSVLMAIYGASLLFIPGYLSKSLSIITLVSGYFASEYFNFSLYQSVLIFVISYLGQDLGHFVTSELTFQYKYTPSTPGSKVKSWPAFFYKLSLHTYFMLPLVFDSAYDISLPEQVLSWFLVLDRIIKLKLDSKESVQNLKVIREWLDEENLADDVTTHYWFSALKPEIKKAFADVANDKMIFKAFNDFFPEPAYKTEVLESMNEVYVAALENNQATSDNVFYSNHVDGPWMCYPFASVYRAIVAVNHNDFIKTIFPAQPTEKILTDGEMWAFDFNREVHRIESIKTPKAKRFTTTDLGLATSVYDTVARLAFLKTLAPKSFLEHVLWFIIMLATRLFYGSIRAAGNSGAISFLALTGVIMYFTRTTIPLFMISSSFIHYFIYIATYYFYETHRDKIMFEGFKKTVMFYKSVAFYHLISNYLYHMVSVDWISLGMIISGFGLSGSAAAAIGLDQTYFGAELGRIKPNRISTFPYNLTHHPMIIGNIIGLLGFYKLDGFREALPWLVPMHILLYTVHMLQEHFDIKKSVIPGDNIGIKEE